MLYLLIQWTIIFCLCLILGHGNAWTFSKKRDIALTQESQAVPFFINLLLGLGLMAGIGHLMSLFAATDVQGYPYLLIPVLSLLLTKEPRQSIAESLRANIRSKSAPWLLAATLVIVIVAFGLALRTTTNLDEGGYYLPLVKWIESYKVTAGTALLNHRLGFNSSLHMLSALFGGTYIYEGGMYEINAFLFIGFNLYFLSALIRLVKSAAKKESNTTTFKPSDLLLSSALIFPFTFLCDSMDSDYLSIMGGIVMIAWLWENMDKEKTSIPAMGTMFVICTFLITVKPFAVFLMAGPIYLFVKNRLQKKDLLRFITLAGIVILPWLISNYYISGYLIFPVYYLDLFNPDWKVPLAVAQPTYEVIGEFAKLQIIRPDYLYDGVTSPALSEWFPIWLSFTWKTLLGKIVILTTPLSLLALLLKSYLDKTKTQKLQPIHYSLLYVSLICVLWFVAYPSIRFAWAWLLTLIVGSFWLWIKDSSHKLKRIIAMILCVLVLASWTRLLINTDFNNLSKHKIAPTKTVVAIEHSTKELTKDILLKYSNDPHCFGTKPPCAPFNNKLPIEARGTKVEDGFRMPSIK